jgi:hypothetical protein
MDMKSFIITLLLSFAGYLTVSSQTCDKAEKETHCLAQADSVVREHYSERLYVIRVVHNDEKSLRMLKHIDEWEVDGYLKKQKDILAMMRYNIMEQIPVEKLNKFLEYKHSRIVINLTISIREGRVKTVYFTLRPEIASQLTDNDIRVMEDVILGTQFEPEISLNGDKVFFTTVINDNHIREFLQSQQNKLTE